MKWNIKIKHCVYVFCEIKQEYTTKKHKCKTLYVGETTDFQKRMSTYSKEDKSRPMLSSSNELLRKFNQYLFIRKKPLLSSIPFNKLNIRTLNFPNLKDDAYRKEVEGYLITRLNPPLNRAKREGKFELNYRKFKNIKTEVTYVDYQEDCHNTFRTWYFGRTDLNWETEIIYSSKLGTYVDRNSWAGEHAVERNLDKKYNTWFWKTNELQFKYDLWRTNRKKWFKDLRYR
jgi:hypothetical protein